MRARVRVGVEMGVSWAIDSGGPLIRGAVAPWVELCRAITGYARLARPAGGEAARRSEGRDAAAHGLLRGEGEDWREGSNPVDASVARVRHTGVRTLHGASLRPTAKP